MKNKVKRPPSSTSKYVFPQKHEMVFIKGQGEQAPLVNKRNQMSLKIEISVQKNESIRH
jgi:hypothetical protein